MVEKHYKDAFERISDSRKEEILEVGIEEFASKGYENANINIIAKNAGISIGLMYKYFATKEDLFITCINRGMSIIENVLGDIMKSDDKILIKAEKLIKAVCHHARENTNYIRLYNEITSEKGSERTKMLVDEIESKTSSTYITAIAQALAKNDVRPDLDPRLFAFFFDNLLMQLQFSYTCDYYRERFKKYTGIDVEELDDDQIVNQLLKFVESAFTFQK